ncbi:Lipase member K [Halotydeus destructor]|nr:Lipase member K [Halotydeus destructor]
MVEDVILSPIMLAVCVTCFIGFVISKAIYNYFGLYNDLDVKRSTEEIILSRGFQYEEDSLVTKDGYRLFFHRIINPLIIKNKLPLKPVLFLHGGMASSSCWIINGKDAIRPLDRLTKGGRMAQVGNTMAFAVANQGYDVWLGNYRSSFHAKGHTDLASDDPKYWDFSLDELIAFDTAAMIDHVLKRTQANDLALVTMSQSSTLALGLMASQAKYNDLVKPWIALAPFANLVHMPRHMEVLEYLNASCMGWLNGLLSLVGNGPIFHPFSNFIAVYLLTSHPFTWVTNWLTKLLLYSCGVRRVDDSRLEAIVASTAGTMSRKTLAHVAQMVQHEAFVKFDFGPEKNMTVYGTEAPTAYDLDKITNKHICFMAAKNDSITKYKNVQLLERLLPVPLMDNYVVPDGKFNHGDFLLGKQLGKFVNCRIIENLERAQRVSTS